MARRLSLAFRRQGDRASRRLECLQPRGQIFRRQVARPLARQVGQEVFRRQEGQAARPSARPLERLALRQAQAQASRRQEASRLARQEAIPRLGALCRSKSALVATSFCWRAASLFWR
jgi:hypothetical protein